QAWPLKFESFVFPSCAAFLRGEGAADHDPLHLARAFVYAGHPDIAHEPLDRILAGVTVTAVDLHCGVARAPGGLRRPELGHRRFFAERQRPLLAPSGAQRQEASRVQLDLSVGELELDRLIVGDRAAELPALARVAHRVLEGCPAKAERLGRDADAATV